MKKLLTILIFAVAVVAAFVIFYTGLDRSVGKGSKVMEAVPRSAALIFETDEGIAIWRDLASDNLIYKELKSTDLFFRSDALIGTLDSILTEDGDLESFPVRGSAILSIHTAGASDFDILLCLQTNADREPEEIVSALNALLRPTDPPVIRSYDGVNIYSAKPRYFDQKVHFFVQNGLLAISPSAVLIEESVRALLQEASILENDSFRKVRSTRSSVARGELYVNYENFKSILKQYTSPKIAESPFFDQPFAGWSALDFSTKPNAIRFNGFVLAKDSSEAALSAFHGQTAVPIRLLDYLPSNTAYFVFLGYGNFQKYRENQREINSRAGRKYKLDSQKQKYDDLCNCDMEDALTSWISDQAATFISEPVASPYSQNRFAAIMSDDGQEAFERLIKLEDSILEISQGEREEELFQGYKILRLHIGSFYADILGDAFFGLDDPYAVQMDDVIILAQSLNALRNLINTIEAHRTLARDPSYRELTDQTARESNLLIYSSMSRSPAIYQNLLGDEYAETLEKHIDILRKFQAFVYQVSYYRDDLYYNQILLRYHPGYSPETSALWEKRLKAPVAYPPRFFTNHYTGALEILVQDTSHRLYLLDNRGKTLWERKLDGVIRGDIHQVDVYKNEKWQMLFNTDDMLYLLDRNGEDVTGFPIRLKSPATSPVAVADYDRSRDYRFFIPVEGGEILCYDGKGEKVTGWSFKDDEADIITEITHIRLGKKDYLFAMNANHRIHLLNRQGEPRHVLETRAENYFPGGHAIEEGSDITGSALWYCDAEGNAYRLGFDDRLQKIPLSTKDTKEYIFADWNDDGGLNPILLSTGQLAVYTLDGDPVFETDTDGSGFENLKFFKLNESAAGIVNPSEDRIYLYDEHGRLRAGFPLFGSHAFVIDDMNDDGFYNLITAGADGFIYAYAIE